MRLHADTRHRLRKALDKKLTEFGPLAHSTRPRKGWIRAIREALGMSARQFARRSKVSVASALELEVREARGTVSIEMLEKAARALQCKFVYAFVPASETELTLDDILSKQVRKKAEEQMKEVAHSMRLEDQATTREAREEHTSDLAKQLKAKLDPLIWE